MKKECEFCEDGLGFIDVFINEQHSTRDVLCQECNGEGFIEVDDDEEED